MFKKRSLQVSVVKTPRKPAATNATPEYTPSELDAIKKMVTKDNVKFAAITFVSVVGSVVLMKTVSEIAINYAPKN